MSNGEIIREAMIHPLADRVNERTFLPFCTSMSVGFANLARARPKRRRFPLDGTDNQKVCMRCMQDLDQLNVV